MPDSNDLKEILRRSPGESEFHQAVEEVFTSVKPVLDKNPAYVKANIFERMVEPERLISFRVTWVDDEGAVHVNRGYRVQMNSALGPYKGGLRFHPSVNPSILKFLAFEQVFKNALTGIPMGGGKGGSDFDPKGRSDGEVMRFCQNFMTELSKHIGNRTDIPAGDIGVGAREIGYLFGTYKKLRNEFTGVLTGKGLNWGGSLIRTQATGYGLIYFAENMLAEMGQSIEGKRCLVSGSGNVAQYAVEKIIQLGGVPLTMSDSSGFIYEEEGITQEKLDFIKELKNNRRGRISEYADQYQSATYTPYGNDDELNKAWDFPADCIFPCATQNEINVRDAEKMKDNGVMLVAEGSNMSTRHEAINVLDEQNIRFSPGKASNAGGVATSGIEMMQNYGGTYWTAAEVDQKLKGIMKSIHDTCIKTSKEFGKDANYLAGANIAGFIRVADAMLDQGVI